MVRGKKGGKHHETRDLAMKGLREGGRDSKRKAQGWARRCARKVEGSNSLLRGG